MTLHTAMRTANRRNVAASPSLTVAAARRRRPFHRGLLSMFAPHSATAATSGMSRRRFAVLIPFLLLQLLLQPAASADGIVAPICSADDDDDATDPNLRRMAFDIGYGEEVFDAYVEPDVSTFYREEPGSRTAATPSFNGLSGKFINMSPVKVRWYWDPANGEPGVLMGVADPFLSVGTATFPTHKFYFTDYDDTNRILKRFTVVPGQSLYHYDPFEVPGDPDTTKKNLGVLTYDEYQMYEKHRRTLLFNDKYKEFTGRNYEPMYPRNKPSYYLWRADYFGQQHWVTTKETHFVSLPPDDKLTKITGLGRERVLRDDEPRLLQDYRTDEPTMNMTLTVLSCAPRAFEIRNFLSEVEVDHILKLATGLDLSKSATSGGGDESDNDDRTKTRTSYNTWVKRETTPVVDTIYRRAADLLRIDEALMRRRDEHEFPDLPSKGTIAEELQLVHYGIGQEYTPHHDYGFGDDHDVHQQERYATLLLYLNEGMEGGETSFPRWRNAETSEPLMVKPEKGKAVLFYSELSDGNFDDLSQHSAEPIRKGEKWLMNLWVHDPIFHM